MREERDLREQCPIRIVVTCRAVQFDGACWLVRWVNDGLRLWFIPTESIWLVVYAACQPHNDAPTYF